MCSVKPKTDERFAEDAEDGVLDPCENCHACCDTCDEGEAVSRVMGEGVASAEPSDDDRLYGD